MLSLAVILAVFVQLAAARFLWSYFDKKSGRRAEAKREGREDCDERGAVRQEQDVDEELYVSCEEDMHDATFAEDSDDEYDGVAIEGVNYWVVEDIPYNPPADNHASGSRNGWGSGSPSQYDLEERQPGWPEADCKEWEKQFSRARSDRSD